MHWLTFEKRCIYYTGVLVYKSRAHLVPKYIEDLLQFAKNEHYKLRSTNKGDLKTITCKTSYLQNSFSYMSKTIWNKMPPQIRNLQTIHTFKKQFKEYLLSL